MLMHVAYTSPAPIPPSSEYPRTTRTMLPVLPIVRNARKARIAPVSMADRAENTFRSRNRPAGSAIPAWKNPQTPVIVNVSVSLQL